MMSNPLEHLIWRLERIAKHNHVAFKYKIELEPVDGGFVFYFICVGSGEVDTGLVFLCYHGSTIDEVIKITEAAIPKACELYGYKEPGTQPAISKSI